MLKEDNYISDSAGDRIDIHLSRKYGVFSRGYFQRLIKEGCVKVNLEGVSPHYRIKKGDSIKVEFHEEEKSITPENIPLDIIYEDPGILVINKQPGIVVHPACGHERGTLINGLTGYAAGRFSPLLVHRLDKDTSGVMVIAKNEKAKNSLVKQFQSRSIKKTYIAAVSGQISENMGYIEAPLGRSLRDRKIMEVGPASKKAAITEFKVISRAKQFTLLEVYPLTGRTHQIRSHLAYIGHPVLGDRVYGGPEKIRGYAFGRQMLHAYKISFTHPEKNRVVRFEAGLPDDIKNAIEEISR